nr:hypothetical protein [Piscirickettsia salmonis]
MLNLADIYTDYLIAQNKHATATGLADLMPDELSHDQITRLINLRKTQFTYPRSKLRGISENYPFGS